MIINYTKHSDLTEILYISLKVFENFFLFFINLIYILNRYTGLIGHRFERKLDGKKYLTPMQQILVAVDFYVTGSFQRQCEMGLRMSQFSMCRCIRDVSVALCSLAPQYIRFQENLNEVNIFKN